VAWATGQFAAYAVFGHRRALDAVIVTGLAILANMFLTSHEQLGLMVLFSLAALVVLARAHAFDERVTWLRRRIGDPAVVSGLYLRGGSIFIAGAVLGSLLLTATASSAPLQGLWRNVPGALVEVAQWLQRYVPLGGASRNPGIVAFGPDAAILGSWTSDNQVAFEVKLPASERERFYWQVATYSTFEGTSWTWGEADETDLEAREPALSGTADDPTVLAGRREVRFEVSVERLVSRYVVSPQTINWVDRPSTLLTNGVDDWFAAVEFDPPQTYEVSALVPVYGTEPGAMTENRLRVASRDYTSEIRRLYITNIPDGAIGPRAQAILDEILELAPADNPYDLAVTMETYFHRSSNFRYNTDIQDQIQARCQGLSSTECFATIRAGYCQYYASLMAILLRKAGVPTRLAQGFLPGERATDGTEVVRNFASHAWVQVYFPGYGWKNFDPTGGDVSELVAPPSGPPETASPRPTGPLPTVGPRQTDVDFEGSRAPGQLPPTTPRNPTPGAGPFIAIALLLMVGTAALGYIVWRRGPRPMHPDRAWGSIGRWAGRLGLAPRASQTVYEYEGVLGGAMPLVRPELRTVANAKVEIAYGRRSLGEDRLRAVAEAHRRLRLGLLRLALGKRPSVKGVRGLRGPRPRK
jgi:transglutaminase-like putative cysteine protease